MEIEEELRRLAIHYRARAENAWNKQHGSAASYLVGVADGLDIALKTVINNKNINNNGNKR